MQLRPYQQAASERIDARLAEGAPSVCIEIPTGGGKTPVIAMTIKRWFEEHGHCRVAVIAHTKELVRQNADKMRQCWEEAPVGICCAGLGKPETSAAITYGTIQTMVRRQEQLACAGAFEVLFIDEAHHIPTDKSEGVYQEFIRYCRMQNPNLRIIGLTATPYRLKTGMLCGDGENHMFNQIDYRVGVKQLIDNGFLCRLRSKHGEESIDASGLHVRAGEFKSDEVDALVDNAELIAATCDEMIALAIGRARWIVFCASIKHAEHVAEALADRGVPAGVVHSKMTAEERDENLRAAATGEIRALCNVNVLSEGYDNPRIDCVVMLRPTLSPGLYYQQVGRGFRLHPDKQDCLVLDFAGNIARHGPVDDIVAKPETKGKGTAPTKVCRECREVVHASARECPSCGWEFPVEEKPKHNQQASDLAILSDDSPLPEWVRVDMTTYSRHRKQGKPDSVRVDFHAGLSRYSHWLCPDHSLILQHNAHRWLSEQGVVLDRAEVTTDHLLMRERMLPRPTHILVQPGKYPKVIQCKYESTVSRNEMSSVTSLSQSTGH